MGDEMQRERERREFFDALADGWEERNYPPEVMFKVEKMFADLDLKISGTILDVGCGQGVLIPFLREIAGDKARIIALDASAQMLKAISGKDPNVFSIHAPAENIPLIDGYVDTLICFSAFPHFFDKAAAAREFYRVLKAGGTAYVLHVAGSEEIGRHHDKHQAVQGDYLPCEHGMRSIFMGAGFSETQLIDEPGKYYFSAKKTGY